MVCGGNGCGSVDDSDNTDDNSTFLSLEFLGHSHITMATIDGSDGSYIIKPIKQKQMVCQIYY